MRTTTRAYRLGDWLVEPALNRIGRGDVEKQLEPKAMDVLVYLLEHPDEVVPSRTLLDAVWPGRVVDENAVQQRIFKIRRALGDSATHPIYVGRVPRRGYRLLTDVRRVAAKHGTEHPQQRYDLPTSLLIESFDSSKATDEFASGLHAEIVSRLSQVVGLDVVRSKPTHRLTGSLRAADDNTIRFTFQLERDERVVWSDQLEASLEQPTTSQIAVAEEVARAAKIILDSSFIDGLGSTVPIDEAALDAFIQANVLYARFTPEDVRNAASVLRRCVDDHPSFAGAWLLLAQTYDAASKFYMSTRESRQLSRESAARGLALDTESPLAIHRRMLQALEDSDFHLAFSMSEQLINDFPPHAHRAFGFLGRCGHFEQALLIWEREIERDPIAVGPRRGKTMTLWLAGRHEEALATIDEVLARTPNDRRSQLEKWRVLESLRRVEEAYEIFPASKRYGLDTPGNVYEALLQHAENMRRGKTEIAGDVEKAWQWFTLSYAALGRYEEAIQWMAQGYENDPMEFLWHLQLQHPGFNEMRRHPNFRELMAGTIGFPSVCRPATGPFA